MKCINCNITLHFSRRNLVFEMDTRAISMIAQWIAPVIVTENDYVCQLCWEAVMRAVNDSLRQTISTASDNSLPEAGSSSMQQHKVVGHPRVCILCGRSVLRFPSELVLRVNPTTRQQQILQWISNEIAPRQVNATDRLCHNCYRKAGCAVAGLIQNTIQPQQQQQQQDVSGDIQSIQSEDQVTSQSSSPPSSAEWLPHTAGNLGQENLPTIMLPNYKRAMGSPVNCAISQCNNTNTHCISDALRIRLLKDFKLYVPTHIRVCSDHLLNNEWESLYNSGASSFTSQQIEHIFSFVNDSEKYNFEEILNVDDNLFKYWIGLTKENFLSLIEEVPSLAESKMKTGLAALLIKYRNGDSDDRIASLVNVPRRTLESHMSKVRNILTEHFVPKYLGLSHLTRQQILSHNLLIPNGLYGHNIKPIFIWDGTYHFTYKSSNYSFQKDTYSLHKYRNLLKPMMIVLCDGYILDTLGPYKAITSDAEIMLSLLSQEISPIENIFRQNDVFILDRGFRNSITLLKECGYDPHMPECLLPGNSQLTTQQANKSRCVTICRWVVEVVNGHLKRDFKLFRHEINNKSLPHLMLDFKIAAALYNRFATRLKDRSDSQDILNVINERIELHNNLADIVDSLHLNRRSANFVSITANRDSVLYFPRLTCNDLILFALGTYQIRQAYSYYSEHVKINGAYIIEVCRELPSLIDLSEMNIASTEDVSLIRGKIRSRHVGRKIYYVYALIKNNLSGRNGILEYCCNCIVGRRTLGCCAHVMTIVWYLSWAKYQDSILPPAQYLNNIFIDT